TLSEHSFGPSFGPDVLPSLSHRVVVAIKGAATALGVLCLALAAWGLLRRWRDGVAVRAAALVVLCLAPYAPLYVDKLDFRFVQFALPYFAVSIAIGFCALRLPRAVRSRLAVAQ